jgi:hypothetical protein
MRSTSGKRGGRRGDSSNGANHSNQTKATFSGIHHRRDKRYPLQSSNLDPAQIQAAQEYVSEQQDLIQAEGASDAEWNEALMLWLSWNSTYEKVTAKMCKQGQDSGKLERLMDEMDQLRSRAIETTERLLGAEVPSEIFP